MNALSVLLRYLRVPFLVLSYPDNGKIRFVSTQDLMCLLNDIHKTNPGPVERALRDADIEHIGQVYTERTSYDICCKPNPGKTSDALASIAAIGIMFSAELSLGSEAAGSHHQLQSDVHTHATVEVLCAALPCYPLLPRSPACACAPAPVPCPPRLNAMTVTAPVSSLFRLGSTVPQDVLPGRESTGENCTAG